MTSPIGRRCTGSLMLSASPSSDSSPRSRLLAKPRARTNACACGSRSRRRRDDNKRWKRCEALRREKSHSNRWIPTAEMGRRTHHRAPSAQKACAAADPPARRGSCGRAGRRPRGWRRRCSRCRDRGVRRPKPSGSSGRGCRLLLRPGSGAPVHRATGRFPRPTSDHPATIAEGVDHSRPYGRPQPLRQSSACPNRLTSESWGQPMGLKKRCSGRIGTAGLKIRCGAQATASRPTHPVAIWPQPPGNVPAECNQSASEMLWRPDEDRAAYLPNLTHFYRQFTMPPRLVAQWCAHKTTAIFGTNR